MIHTKNDWVNFGVMVTMSEVEAKEIEWLWPKRIALGKLTVIAGNPGVSKSFLMCDIAARVSSGKTWPDGSEGCPGAVIMMSAEDDLADTIKPRLIAAEADASKIEVLKSVQSSRKDGESFSERFFDLSTDIRLLQNILDERQDVRLLVIDPMSAYLGNVDSHRNSEVRSLLAPLAALAAKYRLAVIAVEHLNKSTQSSATYRLQGSIAFTAAARAVFFVVKDDIDPEARLFIPLKNNVGNDSTGLKYKLHSSYESAIPCLAWDSKPVHKDIDEVLGKQSQGQKKKTQTDEAAEWLSDYLADGEKSATELFKDAKGNGFTERPIRDASKRLSVKKYKKGIVGGWAWCLPDGEVPKMT